MAAICQCGREMDGTPCRFTEVCIGGIWMKRVPIQSSGSTCHDCATVKKPGNFHHIGCDMERCPACGGQFAFCDCDITHVR